MAKVRVSARRQSRRDPPAEHRQGPKGGMIPTLRRNQLRHNLRLLSLPATVRQRREMAGSGARPRLPSAGEFSRICRMVARNTEFEWNSRLPQRQPRALLLPAHLKIPAPHRIQVYRRTSPPNTNHLHWPAPVIYGAGQFFVRTIHRSWAGLTDEGRQA